MAINFPNTNLVPNVTIYSNGANTWLWNGTTWKSRSSGGTLNLDDLTDVDVAAATNDQLLSYNALASTWQARTVTSTTPSTTLSSLTVSGASALNSITAASTLNVTGTTTVNTLFVNGNLEIAGSTTVINSSTLEIADVSVVIAKNATSSQQANGGGIRISGAGAELVWNHTDSALNVNKSFLPLLGNNLNLGSVDKVWSTVYAQTLNGTIVAPAQTNITSVGVLDSLAVNGLITSYTGMATTGLTVTGLIDITSSREAIIDVVSASVVAYNFNQGTLFYHSTSPAIDWTVNLTNLPTTNGKTITMNIIVPQGATAYKITGCNIDGVTQTIKWFGSSVPTGTVNKIDIWAFSLIRRASTWTVLGSASANFG
jgi:hypothetical protein